MQIKDWRKHFAPQHREGWTWELPAGFEPKPAHPEGAEGIARQKRNLKLAIELARTDLIQIRSPWGYTIELGPHNVNEFARIFEGKLEPAQIINLSDRRQKKE
jgi:hypothetical protein